jgi:hypothetical protein
LPALEGKLAQRRMSCSGFIYIFSFSGFAARAAAGPYFLPLSAKSMQKAPFSATDKTARRDICFRPDYLAQKCEKLAGAQTVSHFCRALGSREQPWTRFFIYIASPARDRSAYAAGFCLRLAVEVSGAEERGTTNFPVLFKLSFKAVLREGAQPPPVNFPSRVGKLTFKQTALRGRGQGVGITRI